MRMRNTNLKQNEHVFGLLSGKWGGLLYTTHAQYHARWLYCACALPKHAHFLDQKSPDICLKSEIKLDFEISYALERRVGPLGHAALKLTNVAS